MNRRTFTAAILSSVAPFSVRAADPVKTHHVAFQVDVSDAAVMNIALNNIENMFAYYAEHGEAIAIELVAFGPGLTMLRADLSPVKPRLTKMHAEHPALVFSACENTRRALSHAEGKDVEIVPEAHAVPSGVVRLSELQEKGWTYLRP